MIRAERLRFAYARGDFTLDVERFEVAAGERVAVVGPSGSGKSTLLNLLTGVLRPDRGNVQVDGIDVTVLDERRRRAFRAQRIGFVFQDFGLLEYLSAWDNILHPCRISRALRLDEAVLERARTLAGRLGVAECLEHRPGALSQGEKQRVAICRALIARPKVILADEATANLDPANKQVIVDLLFETVAADGATLVAVTHDPEIVRHFDRVVDFAGLAERRS